MTVRICFVCLGNICRSPTAEGVMRALAADAPDLDLHIESAGTADYHVGERADRRTLAHAERRGYVLDRRAQQFTRGLFERFDLVIAMDVTNRDRLLALAPEALRDRVRLFRDFDAGSAPGSDVPDPYYGGPEGFEEVLDLCEAGCAGLLAALRRPG